MFKRLFIIYYIPHARGNDIENPSFKGFTEEKLELNLESILHGAMKDDTAVGGGQRKKGKLASVGI